MKNPCGNKCEFDQIKINESNGNDDLMSATFLHHKYETTTTTIFVSLTQPNCAFNLHLICINKVLIELLNWCLF